MKKNTLARRKEKYHQEIRVKPAKRLLDALLKAKKKEIPREPI